MEKTDLSISQLSFAQKLNLMETLWDELTREEQTLESPAWHEDILKDREKALAAGKAFISDWEEAKYRIKRNTNANKNS